MLGGGFDATQAFVGDLANFHIWDRKLSVGEIYNLATCSSKAQVGNVFAWMETSLEIYGGASKWTFEACRQLNWTAGGRDLCSCRSHSVSHSTKLIRKTWSRLRQLIASGFVRDIWSIIYGNLIDYFFFLPPHVHVGDWSLKLDIGILWCLIAQEAYLWFHLRERLMQSRGCSRRPKWKASVKRRRSYSQKSHSSRKKDRLL